MLSEILRGSRATKFPEPKVARYAVPLHERIKFKSKWLNRKRHGQTISIRRCFKDCC
jgi:hypothetical protein